MLLSLMSTPSVSYYVVIFMMITFIIIGKPFLNVNESRHIFTVKRRFCNFQQKSLPNIVKML